jgi:PhoPQ-activated pathogenicity-related protein
MDAIADITRINTNTSLTGFLVAGASKRGWTTWLTAASDQRVNAIAPAVIDILNMPVNLDYQLEVWGDYSPEIQDYVDLGIPQDVNTQLGGDIATMIDPYSYRDRLIMPKMIFIGTNDPYWPVDAIKNYFDNLTGENFIHYVPNAGHDLNGGEEALPVLSAFFSYTLSGQPYPECSWEHTETGVNIFMTVTGSSNSVQSAYLWSAASEDRDFRDESWSSISLPISDTGEVHTSLDYPETGFMAFYIDLEYTDLNEGSFTISTRVFVTDTDEIL